MSALRTRQPPLYGLMAEFDDADALVEAAAAGPRGGLPADRRLHAVSRSRSWPRRSASTRTELPLIVLIGGLVGGVGGYLLQYWAAVIDYPLNVGGRPLHSWPAFIPVTFEMTILVRGARGGARHARR